MVRTLPLAVVLAAAVATAAPVPKPDGSVPVPDLQLVFSDKPPAGAVRVLGWRRTLVGASGDLAPGDGTVIVPGDGEFVELDAKGGSARAVYRDGGEVIFRPQNTRDGKLVVYDSVSFVHVWDRAARKRLHKVLLDSPAEKDGISCTAVSPDGKAVAVGTFRGHVRLFDILKAEWREFDATHPIPQPQGVDMFGRPFARNTNPLSVACVAWTPDGKTVASSAEGDGVRAWNPTTGEEEWALTTPDVTGGPFAFTPDGKRLVARSEPERGKWVGTLWDVATRKKVDDLTGIIPGYCVVVSPDGRYFTNGSRVWDTKAGKMAWELPFDSAPGSAAFSKDGKRMAAGGRLFDLATGQEIDADRGHVGRVWEIAATADGSLAATGGEDGTARVWEVKTGRPLHTFAGHKERVRLALSPDGKRLATGDIDVARVFDLTTGKEVWQAKGHTVLEQVAFSPDGKTLAVSGANLTVHLYDAATGDPLRKLTGYAGERRTYYSFAWTPDSTGIVSPVRAKLPSERDEKTQLVLWDVATGERVRDLGPAADQDHLGITVAPDGKRVAVGGNKLMLVEVTTGKEVWTADANGWGQPTFVGETALICGGKVLDAATGKEARGGRKEFADAFRLVIPPKGDVAFTLTNGDGVAVVWKK